MMLDHDAAVLRRTVICLLDAAWLVSAVRPRRILCHYFGFLFFSCTRFSTCLVRTHRAVAHSLANRCARLPQSYDLVFFHGWSSRRSPPWILSRSRLSFVNRRIGGSFAGFSALVGILFASHPIRYSWLETLSLPARAVFSQPGATAWCWQSYRSIS